MQDKLQKFEEVLYIEQEGLDAAVATLSTNIISLAMLAGTVTMAAVPALFTGFSVYSLTTGLWPETMALTAGWTMAIGVEAVGMVASHVALKLYRSWRNDQTTRLELNLSLYLMAIYIIAVGCIVGFVEILPITLKAVGIGSPILATVLYIARGLYLDVRQRETQERLKVEAEQKQAQEIAGREFGLEAEVKLLKVKQNHDLKVRELELRYSAESFRSSSENLPMLAPPPENLPAWLPEVPASFRQFKYLIEEGVIILPPNLTGSDLQKYIPAVGTDRTGRNWLRDVGYRQLNGKG